MTALRVLELYCGIGGCAAALGEAGQVAAAVDVNRLALEVYAANFRHRVVAATLESLSADRLRRLGADLWWLSPPCQPFTRRGLRRDVDDPRAASFLALLGRLGEIRPRHLALENVPGFAGSRAHGRLRQVLREGGYQVWEGLLCPSELGLPNRRRRFYLVASRDTLAEPPPPPPVRRPLSSFLDPEPDPALAVEAALARDYAGALDVVSADDPHALTACFTSAYGRSPVRSGSYLETGEPGDGSALRRFSPREILRLLGFPESFVLPPELPREKAWQLVGNSLSVPAARQVLARLPELGLPSM